MEEVCHFLCLAPETLYFQTVEFVFKNKYIIVKYIGLKSLIADFISDPIFNGSKGELLHFRCSNNSKSI